LPVELTSHCGGFCCTPFSKWFHSTVTFLPQLSLLLLLTAMKRAFSLGYRWLMQMCEVRKLWGHGDVTSSTPEETHCHSSRQLQMRILACSICIQSCWRYALLEFNLCTGPIMSYKWCSIIFHWMLAVHVMVLSSKVSLFVA
jgi:hypothetical protein